MNLTETLSLLSLLFVFICAVGGLIVKMQRNDEKHNNKEEAVMAIINANKEQRDKDIATVDRKVDAVVLEFKQFVTRHFETESANNKEIMQKLEQNNRDIMLKFDEVNHKFDEVNKEINNIKVDMSSLSSSANRRNVIHKTINDR